MEHQMPNVPKAEAVDGMTTDRERAHNLYCDLQREFSHERILAHDRETRRLALEEFRAALKRDRQRTGWVSAYLEVEALLDKEAP